MFGLFTNRRRSPARPTQRGARLCLESLETRDTPSAITVAVTYGAGHAVGLSGHVTDPNPAGLAVTFAGVVSWQTVTDGNGNYQATLTASGLGDLSASVAGTENAPATAIASVLNTAPVISNFAAVNQGNNIWTFSGTVTDEHAAGLTVTLLGGPPSVNGVTTTVAADGTFSVTVNVASGPSGSATVGAEVVSDWWGAASNESFAYIWWTGMRR